MIDIVSKCSPYTLVIRHNSSQHIELWIPYRLSPTTVQVWHLREAKPPTGVNKLSHSTSWSHTLGRAWVAAVLKSGPGVTKASCKVIYECHSIMVLGDLTAKFSDYLDASRAMDAT